LRIAVIGLGKIARDQHLPAIAASETFELAATVDPAGDGVEGTPHFTSVEAMLERGVAVDAAALCTPPQVRRDLAEALLARGVHVLLEKPPGVTLGEVAVLEQAARNSGATLFAAWHSRFAAGVPTARAWLADKRILDVRIIWREDVRVWHPGQRWIWQPGGLGVFDPGINALSILTHILPQPVFLTEATLEVPGNCAAPIAADLALRCADGAPVHADFDFRQTGTQSWDMIVATCQGTLTLSQGGAVLTLPEGEQRGEDREYPLLYDHFAALIRERQCDVDTGPLRLVADAFLCGRQVIVEPFED
jgi:D-galactose 1-dehydrogenase